jgi:hypothetical protein
MSTGFSGPGTAPSSTTPGLTGDYPMQEGIRRTGQPGPGSASGSGLRAQQPGIRSPRDDHNRNQHPARATRAFAIPAQNATSAPARITNTAS